MDTRDKPWLDPSKPPLPPFDEAEWMQIRLFRAMTPYERWEKALSLRQLVWAIREAAERKQHPDWTESQIDAAVRKFFLHANT
jgi:hypothetical protein